MNEKLTRYSFTSDCKIIEDETGQWVKTWDARAFYAAISYCAVCKHSETCECISYGGCIYTDSGLPSLFECQEKP